MRKYINNPDWWVVMADYVCMYICMIWQMIGLTSDFINWVVIAKVPTLVNLFIYFQSYESIWREQTVLKWSTNNLPFFQNLLSPNTTWISWVIGTATIKFMFLRSIDTNTECSWNLSLYKLYMFLWYTCYPVNIMKLRAIITTCR